MAKIVLTGGGTAGHVTPNMALIPALQEEGFEISYIGSIDGIEKKLITQMDIPYFGISTGKLRRYFSLQNFTDPFRVVKGMADARNYIKEMNPDVLFSKGGFVSVPVVLAAASLGIPCIVHESDMTPGLANKICIPHAKKVCCNFAETIGNLPKDKAVYTGSPIRDSILNGNAQIAREMCGFSNDRPVILAMGGSLGAVAINKAVRDALPELLKDFCVVHICGKDKVDNLLLNTLDYKQFEYVSDNMGDLLAMADIVISRAGANAICEFKALNKPNLLIPLSSKASRGDQIKNAASFEAQGFSLVLDEDDLAASTLVEKVSELFCNRKFYMENMEKSNDMDSISVIMDLIKTYVE